MNKKIFVLLMLVVVCWFIYSPIVVWQKTPLLPAKIALSQGDVFTLRDLIKSNNGNYKSYIILSSDECKDLPKEMKKHKILKTTNQDVIKSLLDLRFKYTESDAATIESKLVLYLDDNIVFSGSISLDSNSLGIQNRSLGWISSENSHKFSLVLSKFDNYYIPLLFIK